MPILIAATVYRFFGSEIIFVKMLQNSFYDKIYSHNDPRGQIERCGMVEINFANEEWYVKFVKIFHCQNKLVYSHGRLQNSEGWGLKGVSMGILIIFGCGHLLMILVMLDYPLPGA